MSDQNQHESFWMRAYRQDTLDAFAVFKKARSLFFWLFLLLPLILVQAGFWAVDRGCLTEKETAKTPACKVRPYDQKQNKPKETQLPAVKQPTEESAQTGEKELLAQIDQAVDKMEQAEQKARTEKKEGQEKTLLPPQTVTKKGLLPAKTVQIILRSCNPILVFASVVYCLSLLIGIKLSILGRLGGLTHSARAFFLSLIAMVLIVPWTGLLGNETCRMMGVLFGYNEITTACRHIQTTSALWETLLYYGRFTGLWLIATLLLIYAQICSYRSVKAIRQRLNIGAWISTDTQEQ